MKKLLILFVCLLSLQASAQNSVVTNFFDKYAENDDFTTVYVTGRMFSLMADIAPEDEDAKDLVEAASDLKGLKILQSDKVDGKELYSDLYSKLNKGGYEDLMVIKEGKEREIKFMIKEDKKVVSELLMLSGEDTEFVLIYLYGEIDLEKIARITKNMEIDGLDQLQKLNDNGN